MNNLITDESGYVPFEIESENVNYWSVENPFLYNITLSSEEDKIVDQIGFRTINTEGSKILLNEKPVYLKGISIHEENPIRGERGHSIEDAEQLP